MINETPPQEAGQSGKQINVLLVDDSAVIRGALARILENDPGIKIVSSVANGEMGVSAAKRHRPDIVILDIEMPVMDGLSALPEIMKASPDTKVIMFSSLTEQGADVSMKAMSLGAVECLVKPSSSQDVGKGSAFESNLLKLIKSLVDHHTSTPSRSSETALATPAGSSAKKSLLSADFSLHDDSMAYKGKPSLIAIGSSTGGPQALFEVIKNFKGFDIPIVITQHMPATFTKILAQHIEQHTSVPTIEGETGMVIENGKAYVAPGGFHMRLSQRDGKIVIQLDDGPPINFCKPAVDPMFETAINIYGSKVLGVILTGMGNDGLGGGRTLVESGGRLIAQDEASSVVWGMPGAVAKAGICSAVLPLNQIGPWVAKAVNG